VDVREVLLEARFAANLSQAELARRAGTSQATVAAYEKGRRKPTWHTLDRLLEVCGFSARFAAAAAALRHRPRARRDARAATRRTATGAVLPRAHHRLPGQPGRGGRRSGAGRARRTGPGSGARPRRGHDARGGRRRRAAAAEGLRALHPHRLRGPAARLGGAGDRHAARSAAGCGHRSSRWSCGPDTSPRCGTGRSAYRWAREPCGLRRCPTSSRLQATRTWCGATSTGWPSGHDRASW